MTVNLTTPSNGAVRLRKILVIGSGFAGFWAALAARRFARDRVDVTLVSPEPVLQIRPRLYEAAPETLGVDLLPLLAKVAVDLYARRGGRPRPGGQVRHPRGGRSSLL